MESIRPECVYFIHAEGTNLVKIGWTSDIGRRFDQLQTASPHPLRLLGVHLGGREVEKIYHRDLAPYRQRGEWFFLTHEIRRWLIRSLNMDYQSRSECISFYYRSAAASDSRLEHHEYSRVAESFAGIPTDKPSLLSADDSAKEEIEVIGELYADEATANEQITEDFCDE